MIRLPDDPEVLMAIVGLCLVCVFLGNLVTFLLRHEFYIATGAVFGAIIGAFVYFDGFRKGAA